MMNEMEQEQSQALLKATEVATKLNVSKAMAYRLLRSGEIPSVRIGHAVRVQRSDLEEFVRRQRMGGCVGQG